MAKLVLAGKKTQTRRLSCRYVAGRKYAIQPGRGRKAIGELTVVRVDEDMRLGDLTLRDARREGFRTTDEFRAYWTQLHGRFDPETRVYVVTFLEGDHRDDPRFLRGSAPQAPICHGTLALGDGRRVPCKTAFPDEDYMTGKPVEVCPRCGTRRPEGSVEDHGYTPRKAAAMKGEGEAVPADVQKRITQRAADNRTNGYVVQRERLLDAIAGLRPFANSEKTIKHLRGVERQVRALDRKMMAA
jgi:hypothetical protein